MRAASIMLRFSSVSGVLSGGVSKKAYQMLSPLSVMRVWAILPPRLRLCPSEIQQASFFKPEA